MHRKIIFVVLIIFIGFFSSGCARQLIVKAIYPSYDETVAAWPTLRKDYGRVVFYYNNLAGGIVFSGARVVIQVDDYQCTAEHGQFVYDDLSVGSHIIYSAPYNKKKTSEKFKLNIQADEILYVEISYKSVSTSDTSRYLYMRIVDKKTALNVIAKSPQYTYAYEYIQSCLAQQLKQIL